MFSDSTKTIYTGMLCVLIGITVVLYLFTNYVAQQTSDVVDESNSDEVTDNPVDAISFSNTQRWNESVYELQNTEQAILPDVADKIELPPPPTNTSAETRGEIERLHHLAALRREEDIDAIRAEVHLENTVFGPTPFSEIIDPTHRTKTKDLLMSVLPEFLATVVMFKEEFDRVRPSYLDPSLETVIDVPGHPAYPSGHAAESLLIALILADLDEANAEAYHASAYSIGKNREIAGVHYASDSEAGRLLGEQFYTLLAETEWYQNALAEAASEWGEETGTQ